MKKQHTQRTLQLTEEHIGYLNAFRDSGLRNVFEAPLHLEHEFNLNRRDEVCIFKLWAEI